MRDSRAQFASLIMFLLATLLVLSNGFAGRIFAQNEEADIYRQIEPIGNVLHEIVENYVEEPDLDKVVEGALTGMLRSLDEHSSFIPRKALQDIQDETEGEIEGIGVSIYLGEDQRVTVFQPIPGSPAAEAGVVAGDIIDKIDDISTLDMSVDQARDLIRGPRGTIVHLTLIRRYDEPGREPEQIEVNIKRDKILLESIEEARILEGSIGYIRIHDFKKTTANEMAKKIEELKDKGMKSLVLDLRWNPGGLLTASREVAELFLAKGTLVTYTKGRDRGEGNIIQTLRLQTERKPILPESFPLVVLVNEYTASSGEIVTGALQYWSRALVVGTKTFGKGSVQTIVPLRQPEGSAIRLTTALYYTPAEVTIHKQGILPDVEVPMSKEQWAALLRQMFESYRHDPALRHTQNHGSVTGNEVTEGTVEDTQLLRAVEILREESVFTNLLAKYHKDPHETQREAFQEKPIEVRADAPFVEPPLIEAPQPAGVE